MYYKNGVPNKLSQLN